MNQTVKIFNVIFSLIFDIKHGVKSEVDAINPSISDVSIIINSVLDKGLYDAII